MYYFQLTGGLGNQLFQYAAARALTLATTQPVLFYFADSNSYSPRHFELDKFKLEVKMANAREIPGTSLIHRLKRKLKLVHFFVEDKHFKFDTSFFKQKSKTHFVGYWQNEHYFANYRQLLLDEIQVKQALNTQQAELQKTITNQRSVAIHVRRGDYIQNPTAQQFHGHCTLDYYQRAIQYMEKRESKIHYYFFSDDPDWVKANFNFVANKTIVTGNLNEPAVDLHLMSCCTHQIIANSSFSWWAAWLNRNPHKIVIAPKKWANAYTDCDVLPTAWLSM